MTTPLSSHHDGHGLNESITITKDQEGPGGASHRFQFLVNTDQVVDVEAGYVQFQKGPRNVEGATPGATDLAVLAIVKDRLESFQSGPFACEENAKALAAVDEAMSWMKQRADNRAKRGVLGTYKS